MHFSNHAPISIVRCYQQWRGCLVNNNCGFFSPPVNADNANNQLRIFLPFSHLQLQTGIVIRILSKICFLFTAKKEILHKVSGTFPSGNLIAIMGPSGAGTYLIVHLNLLRHVLTWMTLQASLRCSTLSRDTNRKESAARCTSMAESEIWVSKQRNFLCRLTATCRFRFVKSKCALLIHLCHEMISSSQMNSKKPQRTLHKTTDYNFC